MQSFIRKWGNSPAVRLPGTLLKQAGYQVDQAVELLVQRGRIIIQPAPQPSFALDDLVSAITADNRHEEIPVGAPRGAEAW